MSQNKKNWSDGEQVTSSDMNRFEAKLDETRMGVTGGVATYDDPRLSNARTPTNHASTSSTYGIGTTTSYGHVKTINDFNQSSHTDGFALSAYQGYLLNNNKQDKLISSGSGQNIKTINGNSILGTGNLIISATGSGASNGILVSVKEFDGDMGATMYLYGRMTIAQYSNGWLYCVGSCKYSNGTADSNNYHGIRIGYIIQNLFGISTSKIRVTNNGWWKSDNTTVYSEYGTCWSGTVANNSYIVPARVYTTGGAVGAWADAIFKLLGHISFGFWIYYEQ